LILRIAKNYVFSNVKADERSDNEEEESGDDHAAEKEAIKAKTLLTENATTMNGTKPVVLVNGKPVEGQPKANGVRERKKKA